MENEHQPDRFETVVALAIAIVSIVGAVLSGVAARSASQASDAQRAGLVAAINREKADVSAYTQLFQDLRAYVDYQTFTALAEEIEADAAAAETRGDFAYAAQLRDEAQAHRAAANAAARFFLNVYLQDDGTFDEQTFVADELQFELGVNDLNPADDFDQAKFFFDRSAALITSVASLSLSLFFLILAQITARKIRYLWFGIGITVSACGLCSVLTLEVMRAGLI